MLGFAALYLTYKFPSPVGASSSSRHLPNPENPVNLGSDNKKGAII